MTHDIRSLIDLVDQRASGSEVLSWLYHEKKSQDPKLSFAMICRKSGIPSKGFLSDLLKGKRRLTLAVAEKLGQGLGLSGTSLKVFTTIVALEETRSERQRKSLGAELANLRHALQIVSVATPLPDSTSLFTLEVFSSFGLIGKQVTRRQLTQFFGKHRWQEIDLALSDLKRAKLVEQIDDQYSLISPHVVLELSPELKRQLLIESIEQSKQQTQRGAGERADCHFETVVISVNKTDYQATLEAFKDDLLRWQSRFECEKADALIRFNVQIYPLKEE